MAFCPRCRKDTAFVEARGIRTCSECGVQFAISPARPSDWSGPSSDVMSLLAVLFRALLFIFALVVIAIGVVFAGCALNWKGF